MGFFDSLQQQTPMAKSKAATQWAKDQSNVATMDLSGGPKMPAFQSQLGAGGMMPEQYQIQDQLNRTGLEQMRGLATGTGPTAWGQARGQQLATDQARSLQDVTAQGQAAQAQARSQLSQRGGLSGGARERLAGAGARQDLMGRQGALMAGQQAREGLATEDQARRDRALGQLPGAELGAAQFGQGTDKFNIQRALGEKQAERDYGIRKYEADSAAWAAQKQAEAIRANKSKGFLEQAGGVFGAMSGGAPGAGGMGSMIGF